MRELLFLTFSVVLVVNPENLLNTLTNPARTRLNRERRTKRENLAAPPPPLLRCSFRETKIKICHASAYLGATQVSVRLAHVPDSSACRLGKWVSPRKVLHFRALQQLFSQSRCLSLFLAMSSRIYRLFPPRAHEPPATLRDRLNPYLSL